MKLAYFARWYAKDGTIREAYFERLKDARASFGSNEQRGKVTHAA